MSGSSVRKCTVAVVAYNNAATISALLASLDAQKENIDRVIVVDNGSSDRTSDVVEGSRSRLGVPIELVRSSNSGFAGGYAEAARHVSSPDLPMLCVNPDVALAPTTLPLILEALASWPDAGIVTVPLARDDGSEDSSCRRRLPTTGGSIAYGALGKLVPRGFRYNVWRPDNAKSERQLSDGTPVTTLEATTGAFMLVSPDFRKSDAPIFSTEYWMYGEDLQLCKDARDEGYKVLMVECEPSLHLKGVSSGWPRSKRSNDAFHEAMYLYYRKNLSGSNLERGVVWIGVQGRRVASNLLGGAARFASRIRTRAVNR